MLSLYTEVTVQNPASVPSSKPTTNTIPTPHLFRIPRRHGTHSTTTVLDSGLGPRSIEEFAKHYVASAGGAHFKSDRNNTKQSFLWRVINDDRILQIEPAALTEGEHVEGDGLRRHRPLLLEFPDQIREHTIGITGSTEEDSIDVFACTTKNEVHNLTIPANLFSSPKPDDVLKRNHRQIEISSLTIDTVFRLHVHSATEIFLCFISGKIQYLTRKSGSHKWDGIIYDDKTWGASFNSLLGRGISRKIEYGSSYVDSRTAQAVQASADSTYLYTVCLNHQLRVWHVPSGRLVVAKDLLDHDGDDQGRTLSAFDRGHLQHLQGIEMRGSILVTFSPRDGGQFKFWDVKGGLTDTLTVSDRYPGTKLTPPDPDPTGTTVWSMVNFRVIPQGELDARGSAQLWILWRNNTHYKIYSLQFDLDDIGRAWPEQNWITSSSTNEADSPPNITNSGVEDATSAWLDYLTGGDIYPMPVLQTALNVYTRATKSSPASNSTFSQKLCNAIAPAARLKKQDGGSMNFEAFSQEVDQAWRTFHRTVEKVNEIRFGPLALAHDVQVDRPVLILSDKVTSLQELDRLGLALHNEPSELENLELVYTSRWPDRPISVEEHGVSLSQLARLFGSTQRFVMDFPAELVQGLDAVIADLLYVNSDQPLPSVISETYEELNFGEAISDDAFHKLERSFQPLGGIETLNNNLILAALDLLPQSSNPDALLSLVLRTSYGSHLQDSDVLQTMLSVRQALWSLVALIVFVEGEFNQEDGSKIPDFDAAELFSTISPYLKTIQRDISFLKDFRDVTVSQVVSEPASSTSHPSDNLPVEHITLGEFLAKEGVHTPDEPTRYLINATARDVFECFADEDYDTATVGLFCGMLRWNHLAASNVPRGIGDFVQFLPVSPWATYVRGRYALLSQEYDRAAQYFHQAAFGLAHGKAGQSLVKMSCGLIDVDQLDYFYNGLPRYLYHAVRLFESKKAYAQSAHFAKAALQALTPDLRKAAPEYKDKLLVSLYEANINLLRLPSAFDTITQLSDSALLKDCTAHLIGSILDTRNNTLSTRDAVTTLQSFPWALHPILAQQLDQQLVELAKKQKTISGAVGDTSANNLKRLSSLAVSATSDSNTPDYLQIVHALRLAQGDFRGATTALYDRLRLVQRQGKSRADPQATAVRHALLALINVMTCVPADEAYIITDEEADSSRGQNAAVNREHGERSKRRRVIVTLADLRRQYQQVLDRCARVERGDFGFSDEENDEGEMDVFEGGNYITNGSVNPDVMQIDGGEGRSLRLALTLRPDEDDDVGQGFGGSSLSESRNLLAVR